VWVARDYDDDDDDDYDYDRILCVAPRRVGHGTSARADAKPAERRGLSRRVVMTLPARRQALTIHARAHVYSFYDI